MSEFDLAQLEDQIDELVTAHRRARVENETLKKEYADLSRQNSETRRRLQAVISRIRALEAEAEAQEP